MSDEQQQRPNLVKWLGVIPGIAAVALSISGLVGAHAVLVYRVGAVERDVIEEKAALDDCANRLARIEGKLDILIDRARDGS